MTGSPGAPGGTMPDTGPGSTGPGSTGLKLDIDGAVATVTLHRLHRETAAVPQARLAAETGRCGWPHRPSLPLSSHCAPPPTSARPPKPPWPPCTGT